jgi:hypothetical protein
MESGEMIELSVFIAVLAIILIIAGKYAGRTIMNAVKIGLFILAVISLIANWDTVSVYMGSFINKTLPFICKQAALFFKWLISNSYEISGKALKNLLR